MFQDCLYLLSATPCDAPAESCVVAGASEAASEVSLGISGAQSSESSRADVSLEMSIETFVAGEEGQPLLVSPAAQAEVRPFGRVPMERGEFCSWQDAMRMHGVLSFEPRVHALG